jgi:hypothetical protein
VALGDYLHMTKENAGSLPDSRVAANDNVPVFDVAEESRELPRLVDKQGEWCPPRQAGKRGRSVFRFGIDGPSDEHRVRSGVSFYSSGRYSGQHANDNQDWPLKKLLNTEGNDHCLALAERYRAMHDAANNPHDLIGKDLADNIYLMQRTDLDEATGKLMDKGTKKVIGKKARLDMPATRTIIADPDKIKKRGKPIAKKWQGDWPLLNHIDAGRDLSRAQAALGWLREGFEAAVIGSETLEAIGRDHGAGNLKGAMGAGRALVFLGFQAIDEFWQHERLAA